MADGINYKDAVVKVKFSKIKEQVGDDEFTERIITNLPFIAYLFMGYVNGQWVTDAWESRLDLDGKEGIAYVHYSVKDQSKVSQFDGLIATNWNQCKSNVDYIKHMQIHDSVDKIKKPYPMAFDSAKESSFSKDTLAIIDISDIEDNKK